MGVLARIFEDAGIATTALSLVREQAVNIKAPRFLHCDFPLGRPLGKPNDAEFQTDVLRRAFALLDRTDVPVLTDHPETLSDEAEAPASCTLPPRHNPDLHPAVDEAQALIPAYRRHVASVDGRTAVGLDVDATSIEALVSPFVRLAGGATLAEVGLDADSVRVAAHELRAFFEEAGLALGDHVPAARQLETWYYTQTATGPLVKQASQQLEAQGEDRNTWYYLLPGTQQ